MDQQLKQRLIGVTIVVALVVIFVPMLFDDTDAQRKVGAGGIPPIPDEVMEKTIELPKSAEDVMPKDEKADEGSTGYRIIPLNDEAPVKKTEVAPAEPRPATTGSQPPSEDTGSESAAEDEEFAHARKESSKSEKPTVAEAPEKPVAAKPVVQEGKKPAEVAKPKPASASSATSATSATSAAAGAPKKAESAPLPTAKPKPQPVKPSETLHTDNEADTPPFKTVTPKPAPAPTPKPVVAQQPKPAAPAPASKPEAAELTAWVVQTGSFTSEAKAKALAEKLRQSRFAAFVERAPGESGFTYRVQVGPELDRARAEQIQKQIEGSVGVKGIIVPHP